jgi:hypothetical protein
VIIDSHGSTYVVCASCGVFLYVFGNEVQVHTCGKMVCKVCPHHDKENQEQCCRMHTEKQVGADDERITS